VLSVLPITTYPAERIFALDEDLFVSWHGTSAKMVEITEGGIAMAYDISTVDVWVGSIEDRPGSLSEKLQPLAEAGVNLEFVIARRAPENPCTSVVFLAPIQGATQARAAKKAGLGKAVSLRSLRVEGPDSKGLGAKITRVLADAGINLRGLSAAAVGKRSVVYIAFDSSADATKAGRILRGSLAGK
jgi:hypothetical protein